MSALEDTAAALKMDALEFFLKNIELATKDRQNTYREELGIASDLMGWKQKWHPRGQNARSSAEAIRSCKSPLVTAPGSGRRSDQ